MRKACAACGVRKAHPVGTFQVDRPRCHGEFHICEGCWFEAENDESWNELITQRIINRGWSTAQTSPPRKP